MSKFTEHLRKLKQDLAPMTGRQRLEHLWEYYKWVLVILAVVVMFGSMLVNMIIQKNTELVLGGVTVNITLSEQGRAVLQDGVLERFGTPGKRQEVTLSDRLLPDPQKPENYQMVTASSTWMTANVMSKSLDYALLDQAGLDFFAGQGIFGNLTAQLTAEQMEALKEYIVMSPGTEEVPSYPVAIDISGLEFAKQCVTTADKVYIAFPGNTERVGRISAFLDYILNWR